MFARLNRSVVAKALPTTTRAGALLASVLLFAAPAMAYHWTQPHDDKFQKCCLAQNECSYKISPLQKYGFRDGRCDCPSVKALNAAYDCYWSSPSLSGSTQTDSAEAVGQLECEALVEEAFQTGLNGSSTQGNNK